MAEPKKAQKKLYDVTSAFVWDKQIKKPGGTVDLTDAEAFGLKKRGKIEEQKTEKEKAAAKKSETTAAAKSAA